MCKWWVPHYLYFHQICDQGRGRQRGFEDREQAHMRMLWGCWLQREKSFESGRSLSTGHWFDTLCLTCFWLLHVAALSPFFFLPCCRCWPWMGKRWARSPRSGAACRSGFGIINSKWLLKLQITTEFCFKVKTASNFFLDALASLLTMLDIN